MEKIENVIKKIEKSIATMCNTNRVTLRSLMDDP